MLQELCCGHSMQQDLLLFSTTLHIQSTCCHHPTIINQACLAAPPIRCPLKIPDGRKGGAVMGPLDVNMTLGKI